MTRFECARALLEYLCSTEVDKSRTIIEFGAYGGTCLDIYESFSDRMCLDNYFMQSFIDCVHSEDASHTPQPITHRVILDVNVGDILNIEERQQHSKDPQAFDISILFEYLARTLPSNNELHNCKSESSCDNHAILLHYLTFHRLNKISPLPSDILRFRYERKSGSN